MNDPNEDHREHDWREYCPSRKHRGIEQQDVILVSEKRFEEMCKAFSTPITTRDIVEFEQNEY